MEYKYITKDNLENIQTYSYSVYGGAEFLNSYEDSRLEQINSCNASEGLLLCRLEQILLNIYQINTNAAVKSELNKLIQSFEVRKRLYDKIDINWRPLAGENNDYKNVTGYINFARILVNAYKFTNNIKYFNSLLKVNDILLSIQDKLHQAEKQIVSALLKEELAIYYSLKEKAK